MAKTTLKIHVSRDFSFAEFDIEYDPATGEGLPSCDTLLSIWNRLPGKAPEQLAPPRANPQSSVRREPPATANQRRLLEHIGAWEEGLTKAQASKILNDMGY